MMRNQLRNFLYLGVFSIFMTPALVCLADDRARDRASLRGIKAVAVRVHTFEHEWVSELAKVGLTEDALQTSVERQLEKSGIPVIAEEAYKNDGYAGILNVRMKFLDPEPPKKTFLIGEEDKLERFNPKKRYVYAIRLNFRQPASLRRNPEVEIFAITWQTESVGLRRLALIRENFENVVNVFIEAYLSENPGNPDNRSN
jgi:hypothetical protein